MPKYKNMDKSREMKYSNAVSGGSGKVMKNHGNTKSIATSGPQKFDVSRVQRLGHEKKGYAEKAFEYKY